jgi:hypothetical protein
MQTVQRYLINNLVIAYISGYHGRNSKVYDRRLTLHRGVSNPVTFTFKNEDQKEQDITAKTYEMQVIDTESKKAVITKTLTILDDGSTVSTKGDASTTITEGDLLPLDGKFYNFAVREVKADGSREVTYADTGYSASGTIELLDGAYAQFTASTSITSFTTSGGPLANTSSSIDGRPGINNNKALHTIAVYTKDFSGTLRVQGTMAASPGSTDWFDITMDGESNAVNTFSSATAVTTYNFYGVYHYVRFSWDNDPSNAGLVDKILFRQ